MTETYHRTKKGRAQTRHFNRRHPRRRISPEGMQRIIAATKKRWALQRAEEGQRKRAVAKKNAPSQKKANAKKAARRRRPEAAVLESRKFEEI
jgi:hypothetical protein